MILLLAALSLNSPVWAADAASYAANAPASPADIIDSNPQTSSTYIPSMKRGGLEDEIIGIKVQFGALNFRDPTGQLQNRNLIGFTAEMNSSGLYANYARDNTKNLFLGLQTGFFYSHIGGPQANFWGTDSAAPSFGNAGANMFEVPLDIKVGGTIRMFRLSLHGGGNFFYRSIANSVAMGFNPDVSSDSAWTILPNFGGDIEIGVTNQIAMILRPDLTFGGHNRMWSTTLGVSIPFG